MRALVLVAAFASVAACPPGQGEWTTRAGAVECRPCLPEKTYGETTPLPAGCPAHRQGILWTLDADAAVAGELASADTLIAGYRGLADRLRASVATTGGQCAADLSRAARDLDSCSGALGARQTAGTTRTVLAFTLGVLVGAAAAWAAIEGMD